MIEVTPHSPAVFVALVSTGVGVAVSCVAFFLRGLNRPMANMLFAVACEIAIAVVAEFVVDRPLTYAGLKITGRLIEAIGVYLFFQYLVSLRDEARADSALLSTGAHDTLTTGGIKMEDEHENKHGSEQPADPQPQEGEGGVTAGAPPAPPPPPEDPPQGG